MNISEKASLNALEAREAKEVVLPEGQQGQTPAQRTERAPTQRSQQDTTGRQVQNNTPQQTLRDPLEEPQQREQQIPLSAIEQIVRGLSSQQKPQEEISDEELDRQLKVFRVDENFAKKFFGPDADEHHVTVLQEMADGITAHLIELIGASTRLTRQEFQTQLKPFTELQEREKRSEFTSILVQTYPSLKGKEAVIQQSMDYLKSTGFKPKTGAEAARAVSQVATQILQSVDPNFNLLRPAKNAPKPAPMATLNSGAGGGSRSAQNKPTTSKPSWDGIFD